VMTATRPDAMAGRLFSAFMGGLRECDQRAH
jgi:hypothetical protein